MELGRDSFIFDTPLNAVTNVDRVFDFDSIAGQESCSNTVGIHGSRARRALWPRGVFVVGAGAQDANDRIIYNSGTGALIYNSNGNAAGGATQFATLSPRSCPWPMRIS